MLVIVTSHWKEDLEWLKKSKWPVVLIDKEGSDASYMTPQHVIPNAGNECSVYIKYIIENYDSLPEHVAFIHGHENSYHQKHELPILDVIEGANIKDYEFIPINNVYTCIPFGDDPSRFLELRKFWTKFKIPKKMPPICGNLTVPIGAQFIVSKNRIKQIPKEIYELWYEILISERDVKQWGHCFEATWHIIFGEFWDNQPVVS